MGINHYENITKEFDLKSLEFKREMIRERLEQCTEGQVDMFNRMYGSIEAVPESKMRHAYFQCVETIEGNK
ncbi:hypothetical protein LCGC14_2198350 [marine sediment metagenome]|uniref:Uncharacterized protein n=1 Tax=marine sediment metagenome TaxID=412755 RepID=A0A0F9GD71_9ZZZZ